jgi:hypothetical protein
MTSSVAWQLVRSGHLVRSLRLAPFVSSTAAAAAYLALRHGDRHDIIGDLRVLGLLLVLGSGYVFDDGAAVTLQASPYSLARRLALRIGCAATAAIPVWTALLAFFLPSAPAGDRWGVGLGLTVEFTAALVAAWAVAAWGRRLGCDYPGIGTTPVLLAALLVAASIPRVPLLVGAGPQWTPAHLRWSGVLVVVASVLVAAMRDPAARHGWSTRR